MHRSEYHAVSPWTPHETDESGNQRRGARGRDQVNSACCRSSSRADRCRSAWRCDSICARALLRTMCLLGWFSFLPDALSAAATASPRNLFSAGVRFISRFMAISGQNNSAQSARHGEPHEGVSLEIGNFCTLSALFNQSWFVRGWYCVSGYRF